MHFKYCLIDYIYSEITQLTLDKKFKIKDFRSDLFLKKLILILIPYHKFLNLLLKLLVLELKKEKI